MYADMNSLQDKIHCYIIEHWKLPELDDLDYPGTIVWYGLLSLPLFDVSQVGFMLESLCTR